MTCIVAQRRYSPAVLAEVCWTVGREQASAGPAHLRASRIREAREKCQGLMDAGEGAQISHLVSLVGADEARRLLQAI